MHLEHFALIVEDYDEAIAFFVDVLGFELVEDSPALTTHGGRPKRWVVVRPPGAQTGLLLARADGEEQRAAVGNQFAGRVGLFLRVDDFDAAYERMRRGGRRVRRRAALPSRTARSPSSSTSPATAGTCSARPADGPPSSCAARAGEERSGRLDVLVEVEHVRRVVLVLERDQTAVRLRPVGRADAVLALVGGSSRRRCR